MTTPTGTHNEEFLDKFKTFVLHYAALFVRKTKRLAQFVWRKILTFGGDVRPFLVIGSRGIWWAAKNVFRREKETEGKMSGGAKELSVRELLDALNSKIQTQLNKLMHNAETALAERDAKLDSMQHELTSTIAALQKTQAENKKLAEMTQSRELEFSFSMQVLERENQQLKTKNRQLKETNHELEMLNYDISKQNEFLKRLLDSV